MKRNIIVLFLVLLCTVCYTETHEDKIRTLLIESRKPKVTYEESSPFPQVIYELAAMKKLNNYVNEEEIWLGIWLLNNLTDYFQFTIYFIREGKILHQENTSGMNNDFESLFEYTGSILETQIESFRLIPGVGTGFIYDFNRDGIDDILAFAQGGTGKYYIIETINNETKEFKYFLSIEKQNYEEECPFMFIEYQGKRGIKVHEDYKIITDELDYYGDAIYEMHQRWSFYTWNETVGRYTREESITSEELEDVNSFFTREPVTILCRNITKSPDAQSPNASNNFFCRYSDNFGTAKTTLSKPFVSFSATSAGSIPYLS
jgi:hypothetical protein